MPPWAVAPRAVRLLAAMARASPSAKARQEITLSMVLAIFNAFRFRILHRLPWTFSSRFDVQSVTPVMGLNQQECDALSRRLVRKLGGKIALCSLLIRLTLVPDLLDSAC